MTQLPRLKSEEFESVAPKDRARIDDLVRNIIRKEYITGQESKLKAVITHEALDKANYITRRTIELAGGDLETCFYTLDDTELNGKVGAVVRDVCIPKRINVEKRECKLIDRNIGGAKLERFGYAHSHGNGRNDFITGKDLDKQVFKEHLTAYGGTKLQIEIPTEIEEQRYQDVVYIPTFVVNYKNDKPVGFIAAAFRRRIDNQLEVLITENGQNVSFEIIYEHHPLFSFDKEEVDMQILERTYIEKDGVWKPLKDISKDLYSVLRKYSDLKQENLRLKEKLLHYEEQTETSDLEAKTAYDIFKKGAESKETLGYSALMKKFYENRSKDDLAGLTAKILSGDYHEGSKRVWKWKDRAKKIRELYKSAQPTRKQKEELKTLVNILNTNNYVKKYHEPELFSLYQATGVYPENRPYGIKDKFSAVPHCLNIPEEQRNNLPHKTIDILSGGFIEEGKKTYRWDDRLKKVEQIYDGISAKVLSRKEKEMIRTFGKIAAEYATKKI
ncbi:hypothetical protein JXA85_00915 [Candidatus Woesearchaeota archaeon]|nr:hypothetical protein [Candidatus Woesearchaeota archaeon]